MNIHTINKEKIIITTLTVIFITVLSAMLWDLYGKNLLIKTQTSTNNTNVQMPAKPTGITSTAKNQKTGGDKQTNPAEKKVDSNVAYSSYSTCIENAKDLGSSKDCCDCLATDESVRKACRDFAATYDFSKNTEIKTFEIPSKLGRTGDYSACTASGNEMQCKQCCESPSTGLACGDYQFCRTACNNLSQ